jgi:pimeloyl-ACP methyl ester carboxylesterase
MPFADNGGVRIHYEVEGQGPPLVLHHGFAMDLGQWRLTGYVDALRPDYRLILMDPRGHGASDKPHDAQAYRKRLTAADVIAVLDTLGVEKAHFFGYSMGGVIGFAVARFAPERLASLIVGGASSYEADPTEPSPGGEAMLVLLRQGARALIESALPERYWDRFNPDEMDTEALIALESLRERVGLADDLQHMTVRSLLFAGENDPGALAARKCAEEMPRAEFVAIAGADHVEGIGRIDLVLPHVRRFLANVSGR